jgi:hypothetical protein
MSTRKIKLVNKKSSSEIFEVRFLRKTNGKLVKLGAGIGQPIYPGETMTVELPSYEAMQLRKGRILARGAVRWSPWSTAMPASSTRDLPKKKQKRAAGASRTMKVGKGKKRSSVTVKPRKKKAKKTKKKKKPAKKKAKKGKKKGKKKSNLPKTVVCKLCGKRIKRENFFSHRWKKHRRAAMASNRKAQATRKKKAKARKKAG